MNVQTRVCIPPEYVDLGEPDVADLEDEDFAESDIGVELDAEVDPPTDTTVDQMEDQSVDPESDTAEDPMTDTNDDSELSDSEDDVPDAPVPPRITVREGTITTSSGSILATPRYRLVRHGVEQHERVCSGDYCLTGGITP